MNIETIILAAIPSVLSAYLIFRAAIHRDAITEQSGIATNQIGAVGQALEGQNRLITSLQSDYARLYKELEGFRQSNAELTERYARLEATCDRLERELAALKG